MQCYNFSFYKTYPLMIHLPGLVLLACLLLFTNSVKSQDIYNLNKTGLYNYPGHSLVDTQDLNQKHFPYDLDRDREIIILGTGGILGITGLAGINNINPLTLEEIYHLDPLNINKFDRHSVGKYHDHLAGDILLYTSFLLPLTFLSDKEMKRDWKILGVIGFEVLTFQAGLNLVLKGITQRLRPYVYDPESPLDKKRSKDAKLSFYSGHTSTTAAMSFYTATVFSEYLPDGLTKSLIWTGAVIYPALAGYLRVSSANHFPTDVIAGYAAGAMIGYFIPQLHKVCRKKGLAVYPSYTQYQISLNASYIF